MNNPTLFLGTYWNGDEESFLIFVAEGDCDREDELKYAYRMEYGAELDNADIHGVSPLREVYSYCKDEDKYKIELVKITK